MWNLQFLVWWKEWCLSRSATPELSRVVRTFDRCSCRGHFNFPCLWDFACSFDDRWCEIIFGPKASWKQDNFHIFRAGADCWSSQKPVSIGEPAGAFSGKGNGIDMARLRPEEVQHNQSSKYCTQKVFASRHESPMFLRYVQGFFARRWFFTPARHADCMHIIWRIAACNHQSSSHIRKRFRTCLRRFGPQRDLFLCTSESNQVFFWWVLVYFFLCIAVMERHFAPRLLQFMWPFLWLLLLRCCTSRSRGWSNGYIVERHFRRLWMSTGSRSTASHSRGLMEPILATRACRFWLCAACGCTSRVSLFSHKQRFCRALFVSEGVLDRKRVLT